MLISMLATVSVLGVNSTHTLPRRLGSHVPGYCGIDRLSLGPWKYELALQVSEGCKLHEPNAVLKNKSARTKVQHGLRQSL